MTYEEFRKRYSYDVKTDRLGAGGFGSVFRAYDNVRDRWVAIKRSEVKPGHENVRLKKEVELVEKLAPHPNVAYYEACYTFDWGEGEYDFGIMQFYEQGDLAKLMRSGALSPEQKASVLTQFLDGMEFLHNNGVIHRDLKPQNILVARRGDEYIPKITDFGISKKVDIDQSSVFGNSLAGGGTLSYASPEQLRSTTIRKNTDLWSFGVITFQMLTGRQPFSTGSHASTSEAGRSELIRQIVTGELPDAIAEVPEPWQTLVRACLVVDPEQRVRNVAQCRQILEGRQPSQGAGQPSKSRGQGTYSKPGRSKESAAAASPQDDATAIHPSSSVNDEDRTVRENISRPIPDPAPEPKPKTETETGKPKSRKYLWLGAGAIVAAAVTVLVIVNLPNNSQPDQPTETPVLQSTEQPAETAPATSTSVARPANDDGTAEREAQLRREAEAADKARREKAQREAQEKAQREARERAEQQEREKAEQEARERAEQEERERAEQEAREKEQQLQTAKAAALRAFDAKNWNEAVRQWQIVKTLDPGDNTGYSRFLAKAKEFAGIVGSYQDDTVQAMLNRAKSLRNTAEVNQLLMTD